MATEPDVAFVRDYFACFESEPSSFELSLAPLMPALDLEDCNCVLNCCLKFSLEARLLLRAAYQRLTPVGRTAFLSTHTREPSPGQSQCMLPIKGMGLEKVCKAHFVNTLQESRDRVRQVIRDKRVTASPAMDVGEDVDKECEEFILNRKRRKAIKLERMARGLSYIVGSSKRVMPARKVKAPCSLVCNYKCYERFSLAVRQQMLKDLLQMPLAKQRQFLAEHVCKLAPKTRRASDSGRLTIYYFFAVGSKLHKVCKTMFLNTYDITDRGLRSLIVEKGASSDVICGNPKLSKIIKRAKRLVFDVDEGRKAAAVMNELQDFPIDIGRVKVEDIEPEMDETEQVILPDEPPATDEDDSKAHVMHSTTAICPGDKVELDHCRVSEPLNSPIKLEFVEGDKEKAPDFPMETVDIKTEMAEPELDQPEFTVYLPRDDDSVDEELTNDPEAVKDDDNDDDSANDSQGEIPLPEEIQRTNKLIRKESKLRGLSYTTRGGRKIPARMVKPNCGDACLLQCPLRVSDEVRQQLLANLLQMTRNEQRNFIGDHICAMTAVKVRSSTGRHALSYHYFLPVDSRLVKVCKIMFLNTYDLTDLRSILEEKGTNRHVVCGNPYFPSVLKKELKFYFEYNEGYDQAVVDPQDVLEEGCICPLKCESSFSKNLVMKIRKRYWKTSKNEKQNFLAKYVRLVVDKNNQKKNALYRTRFFLPFESTVKEVCRKVFARTFQLTTGQVSSLLKSLSTNAELLLEVEDPFELAKEHIAALRMDEDHHCGVVGGALRKLSRCPNVARMYNKYLVGCPPDVEPISYQQYYAEFSRIFVKTGLLLPTKCPDCGFADEGDCGD